MTQKKPTKTKTSHENLSDASAVFGTIATEQNNSAAAAMAIFLAVAMAAAYAALGYLAFWFFIVTQF